MNPHAEDHFGYRLVRRLGQGARDLQPHTRNRLDDARRRALPAHRRRRKTLGEVLLSRLTPALPDWRAALAMVVVLLMPVAGEHFHTATRVTLLQEVDTALLIDDLPIDAYLDTEFRAWLHHASQS